METHGHSRDEAHARQTADDKVRLDALEEQKRQLEEREARLQSEVRERIAARRRILLALSASAISLTLLGALSAFLAIRVERDKSSELIQKADSNLQEIQNTAIQEQLRVATRTTEELKTAVAAYEAHLKSGKPSSGLSITERESLVNAEKSYADLDKRMSSLEGALQQTPEKSLSLPLLRQQMADSLEKSREDRENLQGEVNRLYGMMQWFLGLMITLILGVAALIANSFRQGAERNHGPVNSD